MYRVMVVDDEDGILTPLKRLLMATPCVHQGVTYPLEVETYASPVEALERLRHTPYALVLSDCRIPEMDGATFLIKVRQLQPTGVRMIISSYSDLNRLVDAINEAQITRFIAKPWNDGELISSIAQALAYRDLQLENMRLADEKRLERGDLSREEFALKRLYETQPGLVRGNWGPDGSAIFDRNSIWFG